MKKIFIIFLLIGVSIYAYAQKLTSSNKDVEKAFNLAVDVVQGNVHDNILAAGADYGGEWTRDIAINSWNGVSLLLPNVAEKSLWSVTNNRETIGHQYWDKIIWTIAALHHYEVNGGKEFIKQAYDCGSKSIKELEDTQFDARYGLFMGPSVFNDGIAGYPAPIFDSTNLSTFVLDHKNSKRIKCLSTNCLYVGAYQSLEKMSFILENGQSKIFRKKADDLKQNIIENLYNKKDKQFNYLIDEEGHVDPSQEALGLSFAVLFEVIKGEQAKHVIQNAYISKFGIPSIYPDFQRYSPDRPGRHNNIIWPMVNGFYAKAAVKVSDLPAFDKELISLTHLALDPDKGNNDFREIYNPYNGEPFGGWQSNKITYSCKRQTWSATAYIDMVLYGVLGMRFNEHQQLSFHPHMPSSITSLKLEQLKYKNADLDISITGSGDNIGRFLVNGKPVKTNMLKNISKGKLSIEIEMKSKSN